MTGLLNNKVVIITGAGKGIGRTTATVFAREGARLVLAGRTLSSVEESAAEVKAMGGQAVAIKTDVAHAPDVAAMVELAVKTYGRLDGAFNNAGIDGPLVPAADYPEADFDRVIAVNLKGTWNCIRYQIPAMLASGGGAIVNNASSLSEVGQFNMVGYCAAKAGVLGITRVAAMDYGARGIRVNALSPGVAETPMMLTMMDNVPGLREMLRAKHAIGRLAQPAELAEAAAWMLSDRASFLLGTNLAVDGGYLSM